MSEPVLTPDPFAGWMTPGEVAADVGCTRQAVSKAVKDGRLRARQFPNRHWLIHQDDVAQWVSGRSQTTAKPFGLSVRQAEMLIQLHLGGPADYSYPAFVSTAKALTRRGLMQPGRVRLTDEGRRIAEHLHPNREH